MKTEIVLFKFLNLHNFQCKKSCLWPDIRYHPVFDKNIGWISGQIPNQSYSYLHIVNFSLILQHLWLFVEKSKENSIKVKNLNVQIKGTKLTNYLLRKIIFNTIIGQILLIIYFQYLKRPFPLVRPRLLRVEVFSWRPTISVLM